MRKICEDGTGAAGTGRGGIVVVLDASVVVVDDVVVNIEDFRLLADVGSTVVFDKQLLVENIDVVTDFVKNFLVDPVTFPTLGKIGIFLGCYLFGFC